MNKKVDNSSAFEQVKYLNVGCGQAFIISPYWLNLDLNPSNEEVKEFNLTDLLNLGLAQKFEGIYCSHLIEHLDADELQLFVSQCFELLTKNGGLRIVTPDFDSIVVAYCDAMKSESSERSMFEKILLLEQCVRSVPSGFYRQEIRRLYESDHSLADYVRLRNG